MSRISDWYDRRYAARGRDAMRPASAYPRFLDDLNVEPGCKLLDVGCGPGHLLKAAHDRGLHTYGVDVSLEAVKVALSVSPGSIVATANAERLPFSDRYFDYVVCLGALEHFNDMDAALEEMKRVAKPSARFCLLVPNSWFLGRLLMRGHGTEQREIVERMMSFACWRQLLTDHGFEILRVRADRWPICKVGWPYRLVWSCLPMLFDYTFVFVAGK